MVLNPKARGKTKPARPRNLWPDAGVARLQRAVRQVRPIGEDGGVEGRRSPRVDGVVDRVHPFDVGAKLRLSSQIEGEMHAKAARRRHRIEAREGGAPAEDKVIAFGEMQRRDLGGRDAGDRARQPLRPKTRGVDDKRRRDAQGRGAAGFDDEPPLSRAPCEDGRFEGYIAP
jgi:hypothetical protein